jgi:hypothetical protein
MSEADDDTEPSGLRPAQARIRPSRAIAGLQNGPGKRYRTMKAHDRAVSGVAIIPQQVIMSGTLHKVCRSR